MSKKAKDAWAFLTNVRDIYEYELVKGVLAEQGIPAFNKSRGSGAYTQVFMGMSSTGFDVYVPVNSLARAKELLEENREADLFFEDTSLEKAPDAGYMLKYRLVFKRILLFLLIIYLASLLYWGIDTICQFVNHIF